MNTQDYRKKDLASLWHPYTKHSGLKDGLPIIVRGEGAYLYDSEGKRYLDAVSSWWACNLGHNHPRLIAAIEKQARELQHSILGNLSHPRAIELAAELVELLGGSRRVFFSSDGASAVEAALKIAIQYWHNIGHPERNKFASFHEAYHGDTIGAVSVGYIESFHRQFRSMLFPAYRAESPCCGTCTHGKRPEKCNLECFASMQKILDEHAGELAGVIVESLCQGAAGMRIYSPKYLKKLHEVCKEKNILLIVDEIAMGFGRTGRMFAFEHSGIDPDIVCIGKGLSGGYLPISAAVVKEGIHETFRDQPEDHTFYHGHTFAGNPIACATALETLKIYEDDGIVEQAAEKGSIIASKLDGLRGLPFVADVRTLGMIAAVELGKSEDGRTGGELAKIVRSELFEKGILIRPLGNVVYIMPPLVTPPEVLAELVGNLCDAVRRLHTRSNV